MIRKMISSVRYAGWVSQMVLIAALAGCGSSIPSPDSNSTTATVTLQGQLTDAVTGEPIVGARIDIGAMSAITDSNGHYEMANVPSSGGGVARDYLATITLTTATSPVDMTNAATTPRYPDRKFTAPLPPASASDTHHNFVVGKLSAGIQGVTGDSDRLPLGGVIIELQDNTAATAGTVVRTATSDAVTGQYTFANIEAGVDYQLVGHTSDWTLQGNVTTGKLTDNQLDMLPLSGTTALVLTNIDTYSPRIIAVSPLNNSDIAPGAVNVVFSFNEPIKQDSYSIPNPSVLNNIYNDINVSYGGQKSSGNYAHTMSWNATFDALTIAIPNTGVSAKFTVDLSLLSPTTSGTTSTPGKLKDLADNGLINSPVLTNGNLLSFTTNGGMLAAPPVILSPNAPGLDSNATSVMLDWLPVAGATKGYNIYRSARNKSSTGSEPFVLVAAAVTASSYTDASGFNLLPFPDVAQYYVYRVTSINSDLTESLPSNEVTVKDVISPSVVGTNGVCIPPGGNSLTVITTPVTVTSNGQVQLTFSEALDKVTAETLGNYTGVNVSAISLTSPKTVVLDFSAPITCVNTNTVTIGTGVTDVAGNALSGSLAQRTLTYLPSDSPVISSPNAPWLDSNATSVSLDWLPVSNATKGYNIYRSTRNKLSTGTEPFVLLAGGVMTSSYTDTFALSGFNLLPYPDIAQYYVYHVTSINSGSIESLPSNEVTVKDVIAPSVVGTAGICVPPGGNSLTVITTPDTVTPNGQVQFTFSEALDEVAAETLGNYTGVDISAISLTSPKTVVLDFSAPITCVNTNTVTIGTGITDVAGNALTGSLAQRTLTYLP